jgi:hypothetical protein
MIRVGTITGYNCSDVAVQQQIVNAQVKNGRFSNCWARQAKKLEATSHLMPHVLSLNGQDIGIKDLLDVGSMNTGSSPFKTEASKPEAR